MTKDRLKVYAKNFVGDSGPSKLVSAIEALLGDEGVKRIDIIAADEKQVERLCAEFEDVRLMGRVRLKAEKGKVCQTSKQND